MESGATNQQFTLTHFPIRARAELARLIFAEKQINFNDVRVARDVFMKDVKPHCSFGQLPMLEGPGGFKLFQSQAIARYLARKFDLYPANLEDAAKADMIMDSCVDIADRVLGPINHGANEQEKRKLLHENGPHMLAYFEVYLQKCDSPYFLGNNFYVCDLAVAAMLREVCVLRSDILEQFPLLQSFLERVESRPNIRSYIDKRPHSTM
ncbi:putative Glutathione S-transferase 1 [Paratrimastix pyriformis]|uniref:Glutathione S-transferase 1 n=1 Tax=Paratrimastix pyriformis TaxID=342808 RepID=A0ABQ8URP5_9EUKA|nr:putative Glutathione S-transferase 1 [Paratrimastix pyriformis]